MSIGIDLGSADATYGVSGIDEMYDKALENDGEITLNEFIEILKELLNQLQSQEADGTISDSGTSILNELQDSDTALGFLANSELTDNGDISLASYITSDLSSSQQNALLNQFTNSDGDRFETFSEFKEAVQSGDITDEELLEGIEAAGIELADIASFAPAGSKLDQLAGELGGWINAAEENLAEQTETFNVLVQASTLDSAEEKLDVLNAATDRDSEFFDQGVADAVDRETLEGWNTELDSINADKDAANAELDAVSQERDNLGFNSREEIEALPDDFVSEASSQSGSSSGASTAGQTKDDLLMQWDELDSRQSTAETNLAVAESAESELNDDIDSALTTISSSQSAELQAAREQLTILSNLTASILTAYADAFRTLARAIGGN